MTDIGKRIKARRKQLGYSAEKVAEMVGISPATMYRYEKNEIANMGTDKLLPIAEALSTTPAYLMGWTDEADRKQMSPLPANVMRISDMKMHKIPLIGDVAAGTPIIAEQEWEICIDSPIAADYALRIEGDSMEPLYLNGDIVYIREQPDVDDGQVGVVLTDDSATLKYIYHIPNGLTLLSENKKYPPMHMTFDEFDTIRILGIVVGYTRMHK